jgi:transcriptional regulator with XRE-family HTH domain
MGTRPQHKPKYKKLCAILLRLRKEAELTQRDLGFKLKVPHSVIFKIEHGERRIDPVEFAQWCRACDADPSEIIREVGL